VREISGHVGVAVAGALGWPWQERDSSADLNLRLLIEHEIAHIGLRLGAAPLHRRAYKTAHIPGSLKPSVAAALLRLATAETGATVLDPCCGAGTILVEAALAGCNALGGDTDLRALSACASNSSRAGAPVQVSHWDARNLPVRDGFADVVVTNLPWGGEVKLAQSIERLYGAILDQAGRALARGGTAVVLSDAPVHVRSPSLRVRRLIEISLFGRTPTIVILDA
jgi:23S rRNA G2445 N2-methylase RlmL